jgi:iron complex transport system ATP-binding protein
MLIIVTGAIGIGKTTVCRKIVEAVRNQGYKCSGILTYKGATSHIIIEDIQSGEKEILASSSGEYGGPRTPRYSFNPRGIDFGIRVIDKGTNSDLLVIDEVGQLELGGEGFVKSLELIRADSFKNSILVVRSKFR